MPIRIPDPYEPKPAIPAWGWTLIAVLVLAGGIAGGYFLRGVIAPKPAPAPQVVENTQPTPTPTPEAPTNQLPPEVPAPAGLSSTAHVLITGVTWQKPEKLPDQKLFQDTSVSNDICNDCVRYYLVGKVADQSIILAMVAPEGPGQDSVYIFLGPGAQDSRTQLIKDVSDDVTMEVGTYNLNFYVNSWNTLIDLVPPPSISSNSSNKTLILARKLPQFFDEVADTKNGKLTLLINSDSQAVLPKNVYAYSQNEQKNAFNGFYPVRFLVKAADGLAWEYEYRVPFLKETDSQDGAVPAVTWNSVGVNKDEYTSRIITGCGGSGVAEIPLGMIKDSDLVAAGVVTNTQQKIYTLKDSNNPMLEEIYNNLYLGDPDQDKATYQNNKRYEDFIAARPVFFWKDPFGYYIRFQKKTFLPAVECGKPVIYLYPETKTQVQVHLAPNGGFTYTEPAYRDGWNVIAEPNGHLTDLADGTSWPYLFWEGRGSATTPETKQGFVVAKRDVHTFLVAKLSALGLNEKERNDFIEFWEPRMTSAPYFEVKFYGNDTMNQIAPLQVNPKPQTVIRILMDFKPLSTPETIAPQTLRAPSRRGFTLVEWGGVLRK